MSGSVGVSNTVGTAGLSPAQTPNPMATPAIPRPIRPIDLIFADDFESMDLSAWSSSTGNELSLTPDASMAGKQGLQVTIGSNSPSFVTDDSPKAEPRYRARFYLNPHSLSMANGDALTIFAGYSLASNQPTPVMRVEIGEVSGGYQLRAALLSSNSIWVNTAWFPISNTAHPIEVDWWTATGSAARDGGLALWIDDVQQASLTGAANDKWRIDRVQLGAVAGIDDTTRGTYYVDAFESKRHEYIGP